MSNKPFNYPGKEIDVQWDGQLCIHIGECGRAQGDLFIGGRKPWCQPDLSSNEGVEDVVSRCPTGALTYLYHDGSRSEQAVATNTAQVTYNGPIYLRGDLAIAGAPDQAPGLNFRAALCRCGQSRNKPFCDNSHETADFKDYGAVGESGTPLETEGGKLSVTAVPDGPLLVKGNLTITAASGRMAWQGTKAALCRCGASKNKPFCDGSHKEISFKT